MGMTTSVGAIRITGIQRDPLRARAIRLMTGSLGKLAVGPVSGGAAFFDDDGPKGGPAKRCALTVRLPFRPGIRVERTAETPRLAFDAAFATLERQLKRYRERDRDSKRHPKKYFAARRALSGDTSRRSKRSKRAGGARLEDT